MRRSMSFWLPAILVAVLSTASSPIFATTIVLSDDFNKPNGNLVGTTPNISTGNWTQTGTIATNPIQISGNQVALGNTGQDVYAAFTGSVPHMDGTILHTSIDINLSAVGTGDYFSHLSDPAGTTTTFLQRLGAAATTGGYFLTLAETGGGGATTLAGTTVLNLNQTYHVDVNWTFVPGLTNDTFQVLVDNVPYLSKTWTSTTAEPGQVSAGNFRQGGGSVTAPTLTVDNLQVDVPEPASLALLVLSGLFCFAKGRQR